VATSLQVWPSRSLNVARVRVMLCCFVLTCCSAAFQFESQHLQGQDDPRRIVGEVTRGPTFVFPGKYSVKFSMALQMSQPSLIELIMKNITDAVMDGFKTMLPARNGPVFAVPTGMETTPVQTGTSSVDGYLLVESSAFLVSFNTTSPAILTWAHGPTTPSTSFAPRRLPLRFDSCCQLQLSRCDVAPSPTSLQCH
jgi:hypothetical protein